MRPAVESPSAAGEQPTRRWYAAAAGAAMLIALLKAKADLDADMPVGMTWRGASAYWAAIAALLFGCLAFGVFSARRIWRRTVGQGRSLAWEHGVLGTGLGSALCYALARAVQGCGGLSLAVLTCRTFAIDTLFTASLWLGVHFWLGYFLYRALLREFGAE